jgi:hypothetical protein
MGWKKSWRGRTGVRDGLSWVGEDLLLIVISDISERCAWNESTPRGLKLALLVGLTRR